MIFLSAESNILYSFRPSRFEVRETDLGKYPARIPGIKVQFSRIKPLDAARLPWPQSTAHGLADTAIEAQRLSRATGEDISEETLNKLLLNHRAYGVRIVAVNQEASQETDSEQVIVPMGEGFYCRICETHLQRVGGHERSKAHKAQVEKRRKKAHQELEGIAKMPTQETPDAVSAALASYAE